VTSQQIKPLRLCIDASNTRAGGTVTHLVELLRVAEPAQHGFGEVVVFAGSAVLSNIENRPWLRKVAEPLLEQSNDPFRDRRHLYRAFWQRFKLRRLAEGVNCDLLFVPGGMDNSGFVPMVTMSRNMLPFEPEEAKRYGISTSRMRLVILRRLQARTFRRAAGVIFLTDYARDAVLKATDVASSHCTVIPHGVGEGFFCAPKLQLPIGDYSIQRPMRLLYVSTIDLYKHQWNVVEAVAAIRAKGYPVVLDLVGHTNKRAAKRLSLALDRLDARGFCKYRGSVSHIELQRIYRESDLKIFASSCENMPNILLEAMAAGLPIACSSRGPMPAILGDAGAYFDPDVPAEIAGALTQLIDSPELRTKNAAVAFARARDYSWTQCANDTFAFLARSYRAWPR
jgi:glycosyltransferase involved in cell wall biosynthesis